MPSKKSSTKQKPSLESEWSFEAIGTHWWIGSAEPLTDAVKTEVTARIAAFDQAYSRFLPDSMVTRMQQAAGKHTFPDDAEPLFRLYRQLYDISDGQVTPLVGQLLSDAGYDAQYSLQPKALQPVPAWDDVMTVRGNVIITKQPLLLDFGAAGKGYLVDLVCQALADNGVKTFCVDAGGDMRCQGLTQPLKIGLENPNDISQAIGVVDLANSALCGSAGSRRAWGQFHHIMNPASRQSTRHLAAVWVQAETALLADGLTTALYFTDPAKLGEQFDFEYLLMGTNNSVTYSANFPAELFTS